MKLQYLYGVWFESLTGMAQLILSSLLLISEISFWYQLTHIPEGATTFSNQCRINRVADVANATGLRPQGGLRE